MRRGIVLGAAVLGALAFLASGSAAMQGRPTVKMVAEPSPPPSPVPTPTPSQRPMVDCSQVKCVALTFDDGPGYHTMRLLDMLKKADVHATFFVIGPQARTFRTEILRAHYEGHELGIHTENHLQLNRPSMTKKKIHYEIDKTRQTLKDMLGIDPTVFRPPFGATGKKVKAEAKAQGLAQILWDTDTIDWRNQNVDTIARRAIRGLHRGGIILMHDIYPMTVSAVPRILRACKEKGLTPVTITELLGGETVPGKEYFDAVGTR